MLSASGSCTLRDLAVKWQWISGYPTSNRKGITSRRKGRQGAGKGAKGDVKRVAPGQELLKEIPSNTKQAKVTAIGTIHLSTQALLDQLSTKSQQPDRSQGDGQREAGQMQEGAQMGTFQVETLTF
jgi:hypothetical protein